MGGNHKELATWLFLKSQAPCPVNLLFFTSQSLLMVALYIWHRVLVAISGRNKMKCGYSILSGTRSCELSFMVIKNKVFYIYLHFCCCWCSSFLCVDRSCRGSSVRSSVWLLGTNWHKQESICFSQIENSLK